DLPGCIATGADRAEVEREMGQTIEFHLQGLREEGLQPPDLKSYSSYVEIPA
ncbi:MAG: type II toxin-antitoxin system HicB family antitoxin, partial [Candidatus Latescibacteria bacterium]|nr:type II toxin-antitoxin system HicB family antitoxin [Candidatus Latescibacterota bacterium]